MRTSALFGEKRFRFFEIYGVFARTRGVEPVRTFCGQGGRLVNFSRFCADAFYGRPLIIYSNNLQEQIFAKQRNFKSLRQYSIKIILRFWIHKVELKAKNCVGKGCGNVGPIICTHKIPG